MSPRLEQTGLSAPLGQKKRGHENQRKFLAINDKAGHGLTLKNVLTAKKGLF